jgi:hypothetical protein
VPTGFEFIIDGRDRNKDVAPVSNSETGRTTTMPTTCDCKRPSSRLSPGIDLSSAAPDSSSRPDEARTAVLLPTHLLDGRSIERMGRVCRRLKAVARISKRFVCVVRLLLCLVVERIKHPTSTDSRQNKLCVSCNVRRVNAKRIDSEADGKNAPFHVSFFLLFRKTRV